MDTDPAMIFGFILIVLTLVLPFAYIVNRQAQRHDERKLELKARLEEAKAAQGAVRGDAQLAIEDRLRVLERIVTDPSANLAREIEGLRREQHRETAQ